MNSRKMEPWLKISCLLCVFGFIREIRPSEPYITEYLVGEWRNVTQEQVNREVYPVGTYSYLAQLVIVFLVTDFLRYKPLIIIMGIAGVIIWSMLLWTTSLLALQILEVFYGTYMAAEVAYFTYIYAKVDKKHYPQVTSHTRAAMFCGKLVASVVAQTVLNLGLMNYKDLNYITLATQICATVWAFGLPKVKTSIYFHRKPSLSVSIASNSHQHQGSKTVSETSVNNTLSQPAQLPPLQLLWSHFKNAYTNVKVVQWSIWYAVGVCGYFQVISYIQVLWISIEEQPETVWNGAVDAILTLLAAIFALIAGFIHGARLNSRMSLLALAVLSIMEGGAVLLSCWTTNIFWSYTGYVIFGALYGFTITVSGAEVARYLEEESYGLVFGINTMVALLLQSILTFVVVSETGFGLSVVGQYTVYSFYFITIGVVYFLSVVIEYFINRPKTM
ncbi:thiamine transporter 1 [Episyrphus balteatus]|uniref:thiamine transporter 1 n=1 Tax=Episyrphus balteatus TaxID=286459 RepID=UPI002486A053|nr:thiamine transporter 1 [Episyrphus balteatus]